MARSNIRVLALDLDGTLTNDEKIVTPRTRAALDAAAAQGVTIVLASGRPTAGILPLAKELGLDKKGGCVLAYNGGKIVDCVTGEALYQVQLGAEFVPELCEFAARQDVAILTYNSEGVVCERDQDEWANKECFTASSPFFIAAVPLGVAKDRSLAALLERMGLTRENLMACGDGLNDRSMISYAGVGVAMQNAEDAVKAVADYVTAADNNHDGVAEAIEKFILN